MKMQQRNWKEDLKPYLPLRVQEMLASVDGESPLEEIRLRAGQPLQLCFTGYERLIYAAGGRAAVSAQDCADKIDYWIEHPEERKLAGQEYARSSNKYKLSSCVNQMIDFFQEAIADNNRNRSV